MQAIFREKIMPFPDSERYFFYDKGIYVYGRCSSEYFGLEYCYVLSAFVYYRDVYMVAIFTMISVIVWLAVSTFLAYRFSKKNTEPLKEISDALEESLQYNGRELVL